MCVTMPKHERCPDCGQLWVEESTVVGRVHREGFTMVGRNVRECEYCGATQRIQEESLRKH